MRYYRYESIGRDQYKVTKVDEEYPKGDRRRYKEYIVDFRNGDLLCDCPGFQAKVNALRKGKKIKGIVACKHVKDIVANLKEGGGIIDFSGTKNRKI